MSEYLIKKWPLCATGGQNCFCKHGYIAMVISGGGQGGGTGNSDGTDFILSKDNEHILTTQNPTGVL